MHNIKSYVVLYTRIAKVAFCLLCFVLRHCSGTIVSLFFVSRSFFLCLHPSTTGAVDALCFGVVRL